MVKLWWVLCVVSISARGESAAEKSVIAINNPLESVGARVFQRAVPEYNNTECGEHLSAILKGVSGGEMWALEFIDSWGKIPSGIFFGNLASLGNFEECLGATAKPKGSTQFHGKYCLSTIPLDSLMKAAMHKPELRMMPPSRDSMELKIGACIPHSCNASWMDAWLKDELESYLDIKINKTILKDETCSTATEVDFRALDWAALVVFSLFGLILIVSTTYDYYVITRGGHTKPLFVAFSAISNGKKIFQMQRSTSPNVIECVHGIRSLSLIWVVFGHAYIMEAVSPNINFKNVGEWLESPFSLLIQNATVSVDSFFLMSGLLVSWLSLQELKRRNGCLNIFMLYFHRYIRLTPALAALIFFVVTFGKYIGSGPFWNEFQGMLVTPCEKNWWPALLYVQNYVNTDAICLGHSWYLACDTQLFIISPFIMMGLWRWGWKVVIGVVALMAFSIGYTFAMVMKYDFGMLLGGDAINSQFKMAKIYYPTHTRMGPWLLGILLGYYLYQIKNKELNLSKGTVFLGWLTSLTTIAAVLFGNYPKIQPGATATILEAAFYESFTRTAWAAGLAWIIFACHKGYGGVINHWLSFPFWQPISRLSYCIYLISLPLQTMISSMHKSDSHFSNFESMYRFWGDFAFTFLFAIIAALVFESPIIGLERMLLPRPKPAERIIESPERQETEPVKPPTPTAPEIDYKL